MGLSTQKQNKKYIVDEFHSWPPVQAAVAEVFGPTSALNGNNGEWTNSDDMDNGARARLNKEARTNRFRKNGEKKKVQFGPPEEPAPPGGDEAPVIDLGSLDYVVYVEGCKFAWDGRKFYVRHDERLCFIDQDGTVAQHIVAEYTQLRAHSSSLGCVKMPGTNPVVASAAFWFCSVDVTEHGEATISPFSGWVFQPGVRFLGEKLPNNGKSSLPRKQTALGRLQMQFPTIPSETLRATVDWWFYEQVRTERVCIRDTNTMRLVGGTDVSIYDPVLLEESRKVMLSQSFGTFYKLEAVECEIQPQWRFKNNFSYKCSQGAVMDPENGVYPAFLTTRLAGGLSRFPKTVMCRFRGERSDFITYDITGVNACLAMKRMIAEREMESTYVGNQMSVLRTLARLGIIRRSVIRKLNIKFEDGARLPGDEGLQRTVYSGVATVGTLHKNHQVAYYNWYCPRIISAIRRLMGRVSRGKLTEWADGLSTAANWLYLRPYELFLETCDEQFGREVNASLDHVQRALRTQYVNGTQLHSDADVMTEQVKAKVKRDWAKQGKVPRFYVTYGAGCMYANELPEFVKACLDKPIHFSHGSLCTVASVTVYIMAKPKEKSLSILMNRLIEATILDNTIVIVIYSDDSVYAGRIRGRSFGFDVDIVSCDSSNMELVFAMYINELANFHKKRAFGILEQCQKEIKCVNPDNDREWIKFQFHSSFEGSGNVGTTGLNHNATWLNAIAFCSLVTGENDILVCIVEGAKLMGHEVSTSDWCPGGSPVYERMQFLKHSPMYTTACEWVPCLNMGCIFRSLGTVDGDLTGKHVGLAERDFRLLPWSDRMELFVGSVVAGLVNEPSNRIIDALRERFQKHETITSLKYNEAVVRDSSDESVTGLQQKAIAGSERKEYVVSDDSLCNRYGITSHEIDVLVAAVKSIQIGCDSVTDAVSQFYTVDYGMN